jgi:hypothetical protein
MIDRCAETDTLYGYIQEAPSWEDYKTFVVIVRKKQSEKTPENNKWNIEGKEYFIHKVPVCVTHHDSIEEARDCLAELLEHPAWTLLKYSN